MADLVVGLAKSVVDGALTKAHAAIEEEAKLRKSAQRDLVFITGEFEMMQVFLNVANEERVDNKVVKTWVRQIRELAYDVEDCIELVVHLDKETSFWCRIRRLYLPWIPSRLLPLDHAVDEIEQLKARVQDVSTRNSRYNLISDTGSKPVIMQQPPPVSGATTASNMLTEARDATMRKQGSGDLSRLVTNKDGDLGVISVWGSDGDHGITSIIRKTYTDPEICEKFTFRAWVKLMHPFNPEQFIRSLMSQFYTSSTQEEDTIVGIQVLGKMKITEQDLFHEFNHLITKGRYLVILEDVSNMVEWDAIRAFLPDKKKGSWIIVSTLEAEIASLYIGEYYQILELKRFSAEHSVCALFKEEVSPVYKDKGKGPMESEMSLVSSYRKILSEKEGGEEWRRNFFLVVQVSQITELRKYLVTARFNYSHVLSVWGVAGVGKSAVVKNLYDDIASDGRLFEMWHWVAVSQPFILRDFCWSLLSGSQSVQDPIKACRELLAQQCLVVIDDLQSTEEWDLIQDVLLSPSSKSLIIVITTEATVARHCCSNNKELMFNVKCLGTDAAIDFFNKEVRRKNPYFPLEYSQTYNEVQELILKCGGLPKVIAAIAGSLATHTVTLMDIVCSLNLGFMHHLQTKPEFYNLRGLFSWIHSYFSTCPDFLKPCIFYLSIFPQGHVIRRRRLVRRWIAEGYSRDGHNESAEESGEKHFSELLEMSIVQHVTKLLTYLPNDTKEVLCQVNGFMREYIVSQRMGENLVFELGEKCALTTQRTGRHLLILHNWDRDRIIFETMDFSRLRSLTVFGNWESFFVSESMKMLRVLDLEDALGVKDEDLEEMVKWLRRLKFLSLRGCRDIFNLPWSLGDLRQLQTLDVRGTSIFTLPESITKLNKLQYIRAGSTNNMLGQTSIQSRHHRVGVDVPRRIGKLTVLHTLGVVNVAASGGKAMVKEVKKLTQLRKLGVCGINRKNISNFFRAIYYHLHIESLSVWLDKDNKQGCCIGKDNNNQGNLSDMTSLPCINLRSLKLYGVDNKLPTWANLLGGRDNKFGNLAKLELEMAILMEEDIKFLGVLPQLRILRVKLLEDGELNFRVLAEGIEDVSYRKVNVLQIACGSSSSSLRVAFGSNTMQQLELLNIDCCGGSPLYQFSGLVNLTQLKKVLLLNGSNAETLKGQVEGQLTEHPNLVKPVVQLE